MDDFKTIRNENRLLFEYICGSTLYGTNTKDSDVDTKGIFICDIKDLIGLPSNYVPQVSDERNDTNWYEIGKFMSMLLSSNPTVLESLFIPEDKIIGDVHPIIKDIIFYRDEFVTKQCFKPFIQYAIEQIHKARGLNKKIVNPVNERLQPLDFAYTFHKQGSTKINNWLVNNGLEQRYCGLVSIPNMHDVYGLYYDFGNHISSKGITFETLKRICFDDDYKNSDDDLMLFKLCDFYCRYHKCNLLEVPYALSVDEKAIGYRGLIGDDGKSNELRLSSVSKGEKPVCYISYNKSGYTKHCIDYKAYKDWELKRNPIRYESNLNKNYDSKNLSHTFRLIAMGIEIANGEGILLDRKKVGDAEFLLDIRNHKYEYDELLSIIDSKKLELDSAIANSTIKESVDIDLVNDLLIKSRGNFYGRF